tara:strand:+ start:864 stop:1709 length:846 start_codon:yes stop_codon:yes gene_type:complete
LKLELDNWEIFSLVVGIMILTAVVIVYVFPLIKKATVDSRVFAVSNQFYTYIGKWMQRITIAVFLLCVIWGAVIYFGWTTEKLTLWFAGSGLLIIAALSRLPETENIIAAFTVFVRQQVHPNEEFEITMPDGKKLHLTFVNRNERFNYCREFSGTRGIVEIPHTTWVNSVIANLSQLGAIRWKIKVPLRFPMSKRGQILDVVDNYIVESGLSDLDPSTVQFNYQTKLMPEVYGHFPEQVLTIYSMVSSREYAFDKENAFLDGLYDTLTKIEGVVVAQGGEH